MRVLHVIPSFYPATRYGGPIEAVYETVRALLAVGVEVEVATTNADGSGDSSAAVGRLENYGGVPVRYFRRWPRIDFAPAVGFAPFLARRVRTFDVVHVTALFSFTSAAACTAARIAGVPFLVSPRGSLLDEALAQGSGHKQWYLRHVDGPNLRAAKALHATSPAEVEAIHRLFPAAHVVLAPNGVAPPPEGLAVTRERRRIVFLGRLHPIKGFDVLLPALAILAEHEPEVETVFAGPDDLGLWKGLSAEAARLRPAPRIRHIGPVAGAAKTELLASASALVLTSRSENFGQVVVEALAAGTPAVTTDTTPWKHLDTHGAGRCVSRTPQAVADALLEVLRAPVGSYEIRTRELAARYTWQATASLLLDSYRAMARRRRPLVP